jgi:hypothetical protein
MKNNEWQRQGDVSITRVRSIPSDAVEVPLVPLAYGEVTGHKHQFAAGSDVQMYRCKDGTMMVQVQRTATLVHEEHAAQEVQPGIYHVGIQRELDLVDGVRKVMD